MYERHTECACYKFMADTSDSIASKTPASAWRHPAVILATGFWAGRIPWAPGTFGALWGLPLAWGISWIPAIWLQVLVIVAICLAGIPICTIAARKLGGLKDPGCIVLDEIASLPITFFALPRSQIERPIVLLIGFALHR